MSGNAEFQSRVRKTLGEGFNFQVDRAHDGKPEHVDLTIRIPGLGADKVEIDFNGNVLGGSTWSGTRSLKW
jgi:HSP20 family molecular chaperone IbpA